MPTFRCPGQDLQQWTPDDVYDVICHHCRNDIEFFKDEPVLTCPKCKQRVRNPKLDVGCAEWCQYADDCVGIPKDSA